MKIHCCKEQFGNREGHMGNKPKSE